MYYIIEDIDQLEVLKNSGFKEAYIDIIPGNNLHHPRHNGISLIYLRPLQASKGFIIGVQHSEVQSLNLKDIYPILKGYTTLYCRDKKELLHYLPLKSLWDISPPPHPYIQNNTYTHDFYYRDHPKNTYINTIIPLVKHYERCEHDYIELKTNINKKPSNYEKFFNNRVSIAFNAIERNGLLICKQTFAEHFHEPPNEFAYPRFNLKTTTTRPSNSFRGVNYAALSKENGCRKSFIPRNDKFIEIDISAYHPTLAGLLVNYKFEHEDIHGHFAQLYGVEYKKSKELTFKQLYGGVFKEYEHLEFFSKVKVYIEEMWCVFNETGMWECPVSNYVFEKENLDEMRPQKLFNYVLQNMETSVNTMILWDILMVLRGCKTKVVLYVYDSFLLDFSNEDEGKLDEVRTVFKKYGLGIKEVSGENYHELE